MPTSTITAEKIFKELVPEVNEEFVFKPVSQKEVYEAIEKLPNTNCRGNDEITNSVIKQVPHFMSIVLTHLTNTIFQTGCFANGLKISCIIPLKKQSKPKEQLDSYRPINNLNTVEKLVESLMKKQMDTFLEKHKIISEEHHGSHAN